MPLHSIAGGGTAGGDPDLAKNRGQVGVDGAAADDEVFCDLGIGEPLRQQTQDFDFAGGQVIRIAG